MSEQNEYSMFLDKVSKSVPNEYVRDQTTIIDILIERYGIEVTDNMQEELALISRTTIKEDMDAGELTKYLQNFARVANGIFEAKTSRKITNPDMTVEEIKEIQKRNYWDTVEAERTEYDTANGKDSMNQEDQNLRNIITKTKKQNKEYQIGIGFSE